VPQFLVIEGLGGIVAIVAVNFQALTFKKVILVIDLNFNKKKQPPQKPQKSTS
jgi:hypothetical protein